ncbi:MFS general substrate transporter [Sarocladium strictum]
MSSGNDRASQLSEKHYNEHTEQIHPVSGGHHDVVEDENTFEVEEEQLPKGYFTSPFFIGTMTGICLGLVAGVAGFGFIAPILGVINADIGPDGNIVWVALTYTLTSAVCLTIIGRVTDIFGRRWIFVGGAFLGIIGSIICAVSTSVNMLIGGMTVVGIAASTQLSYYYVMGELVPMKWRLAGNAVCYSLLVPLSGFAPVVSWSFVQDHPSVGWRGSFYVLIGINTASFLCWLCFYFPPTFQMKHGQNASLLRYIKDFDYVGTVLYTGSLMVLMMGLNWGGGVYPWKSAQVIGSIVSGFVGLVVFVLWESFANLKEPLVPMHLFRNGSWLAATILSGLGASVYYALAIVWPSMVAVLYNEGGVMTNAWYSSFVGLWITVGQVLGGFAAKRLGYIKWQIVVTVFISGIFFGCTATSTPDSKARAAAFVAVGTFMIGWAESLAITVVTLTVWDQTKLGSASGLAGSIRFFITSIAATVYNVTLTNRLGETIPERVPAAVVKAGLPETSVVDFLTALTTGAPFEAIKGISDSIIAAGVAAYKEANAEAYRTVFFVSIAFSVIALICACCLPNVDKLLSGKVAQTLHKGKKDEKRAMQDGV